MQNVSASGVRSGARGHPGTGDDLVSGWQRKHDAIAAAALVLFARDDDPAQAAEHLSALTFGQVNSKSMMGTIQLTDSEADRIIGSGIAVFMRAYTPSTSETIPTPFS